MDFLESIPGDRGSGMLMERPEMTCKVELLMDIDFLVTEDLVGVNKQWRMREDRDNSQTTPRSATKRALVPSVKYN